MMTFRDKGDKNIIRIINLLFENFTKLMVMKIKTMMKCEKR
jgi:hypothetical protein